MSLKKQDRFYLWALVLLVAFFAASVVFVYRYMSNNLILGDAASEWVTVDLTDAATIDRSKTTALWNKEAGYVEAGQDKSNFARLVYSADAHYGGTLAVSPDFANDGIMLSCSYYGCYKTDDAANSWNLSLDDYAVLSVEMSPDFANDNTIIALGFYGMFLSTDAGDSWTKVDSSIYAYLGSIEFSPDFANDSTIYATSYGGGLYKSTNSGASWSNVATFPDFYPMSIAVSPDFANDSTLWVSTEGNGVYKSVDAGATWLAVNTGISDLAVGTLAVSPDFANDSTLFLTAIDNQHRLYKSTDAGANWSEIGASISNDLNRVLWKVFVSPDFANDSRVVVSDYTGRRSWYSDDAGASWTESNLSTVLGEARAVNKMEVDNSIVASADYLTDQTLWMASINEKGLLKSTNGGETWAFWDVDDENYFSASTAEVHYAPDYETSGEIWALDFYLGPVISSDNAKTWEARTSGLEKYSLTTNYDDFYLEDMFFSPNYENDNTLFVAYSSYFNTDKFLYKSTNRGESWSLITFPVNIYPWSYHMAFSPDYANDNKILLGIGWEGLFESTDNGENWSSIAAFPADRINDLEFAASPNEYIVAAYNNSFYYTDDDGANFTSHSVGGDGLVDIFIDPNYASNGKFYSLSYTNDFAEISDAGATVNIKSNGLPTDTLHYGGRNLFLSPDYANDGKVFVTGIKDASSENGSWPYNLSGKKAYFYQSLDAAANWTQLNYNFIHSILSIEAHAMSPYFLENEEQLLGSFQEGLYRNYSYKTNTTTVESNILKELNSTVRKVRVIATESNLSSGTIDYYVSSDGGNHWTPAPNNQEVTISDHPGSQLVWRAVLKSNDGIVSPRIESVQLFYESANANTSAIYINTPSPSVSLTTDYDGGNFVNIDIYNENYDEVIISNHEDLLYDGLNKDSGKWMDFGFDNIYENWALEDIDNATVYMRFRRETQSSYNYSTILVLPVEDIPNSRNLTAEVKAYEESNTAEFSISQGFGLVEEYPGKVRYTCDYDYEKFHIVPYLRNLAGEWFAGQLKEGSLTVYEFPELSFTAELTMRAVAENTYEFTINRLDKEAHFELWLRQYYDDLVIREDFVLADSWLMYQQAKQKELLMVDLCHFLRVYKNDNYIEVYSQPNYQGFRQTIYANIDNFAHEFIGDNNISSIKTFGDINIELYSEAYYKGRRFDFKGDVNNFNGTTIGNDNASSLRLVYSAVKEKLALPAASELYLDANLNSELLEKLENAAEYEIVWHDGDWYKLKITNNREAWYLKK